MVKAKPKAKAKSKVDGSAKANTQAHKAIVSNADGQPVAKKDKLNPAKAEADATASAKSNKGANNAQANAMGGVPADGGAVLDGEPLPQRLRPRSRSMPERLRPWPERLGLQTRP